jgi:uncharacterized membrane protein YkoI
MKRSGLHARPGPLGLLAFAALLASADVGAAQSIDYDHVAAREALRRGEVLPLGRILAIANRAVPGDVVLVRLIRQDFGWRYRVRILTETGRLRLVRIDASTGRIVEIVDE